MLRHLDLVVLALAFPVFVLADLSLLGYAVGAVAWLVQKFLAMYLQRRADASKEPKVVVGMLMGGAIARGWICGLTVISAGLILGESVGLAATLLILLLFTLYISTKFAERGLAPR